MDRQTNNRRQKVTLATVKMMMIVNEAKMVATEAAVTYLPLAATDYRDFQ